MHLIIDIGNTRVKVAVYQEDVVVFLEECLSEDLLFFLEEKKMVLSKVTAAIVSCVSDFDLKKLQKRYSTWHWIFLNQQTKVPFINAYASKNTLGVDRIALVAAAAKQYPDKDVLVIDAGTCVTFDFKTRDNVYLGGAISLGLAMRYKALHHFTAKLPLLELPTPKQHTPWLGTDTKTSMDSGVVYGFLHEIEGCIRQYQSKYENLTVILTGGDAHFLSLRLKNSIFANPKFLLEGLRAILEHNTHTI